MAKRQLPTPEELRQLLRYEPETGRLYWLPRGLEWFKDDHGRAPATCFQWNKRWANTEALTAVNQSGHKNGIVLNNQLLAHRVIWAIAYGHWPTERIDHIDGNPQNNRLDNLRDVPMLDNMRNVKRQSNNTSGAPGVSWHRASQKWSVRIGAGKRQTRKHVGYFATLDEAIAARTAAEVELGYHPNHGR